MAIVSSSYAGTVANGSGFGSMWLTPENAEGVPDSVFTSSNPGSGNSSTGLAATNFTWSPAIPSDATILIVGVTFHCYGTSPAKHATDSPYLIPSGTARPSNPGLWPTSAGGTQSVWGNPTEWGWSALAPSDVNDTSFGVECKVFDAQGNVDAVYMEITWEPVEPPPPPPPDPGEAVARVVEAESIAIYGDQAAWFWPIPPAEESPSPGSLAFVMDATSPDEAPGDSQVIDPSSDSEPDMPAKPPDGLFLEDGETSYLTIEPIPKPSIRLRGDSIRFWFTGAGSDGGAQASQAASLGGYRSSTEAERVGVFFVIPFRNLRIPIASGSLVSDFHGTPNIGSLTAFADDELAYAHDGSTFGELETVTTTLPAVIADDNPQKWLRGTLSAAGALSGTGTLEFHPQFGNVFGQSDGTSTGNSTYRAIMARNELDAPATGIELYIRTLATSKTSTGNLGGAGAGTITATDFHGWPSSGWVAIYNGGTLREIAYYTSRTTTTLTVPSGGRGRLGTSATAGANGDTLQSVPGVRIAWEAAVGGAVQTIASATTAPTGLSWSTGLSGAGITVGTLQENEMGAIWIQRDNPSVGVAHPKRVVSIGMKFTVAGESFDEHLHGLYRISDSSMARYELHIGTGSEPDITTTPTETFTSLPHTTTATLTAGQTSYLVTNRRNAYNLASESRQFTRITVDGGGNEVGNPPSAPVAIRLFKNSSSSARLEATYAYDVDDEANQADTWLIYIRTNGTNPDPSVDTPATATMVKVDGMAFLEYDQTSFGSGQTLKAIVRGRRTGSPNSDSASSNMLTLAWAANLASAADASGFFRDIAEA